MKVYYVEYDNGWKIRETYITDIQYISYHNFNSSRNRVAIGKWIDGKFYRHIIRIDEFFKSKEDARKYIDKADNNSFTLKQLQFMFEGVID